MAFGAGLIEPLVQGLGSLGAGLFTGAGKTNPETKMQRTQRKLIDRLLSSLDGNGEFSDLYSTDQNVFNKSFVEPAQALFRNRIAPEIQQQYIASGQQRGTGLDDALTRAGVDLDSMLNQYMYQFNQDANNRKQNTISSILGAGSGAPNQPTTTQNIFSGLGGYLSSPGFANTTSNMFRDRSPANNVFSPRKGFEQD